VVASPSASQADAVIQSARAGEPDRYLAALLAPAAVRPYLVALAAFSSELGRVASAVTREPLMGEIRLQWWREALAPAEPGALSGNPVADAVRVAVAAGDLRRDLLIGAIEASSLDLARLPLADDAALAGYLARRQGSLFELAAAILGGASLPALPAAVEASGSAYGLARLLLGLPRALARGRLPLPLSRLQAAGISPEAVLAGSPGDGIAGVLAALRAQARDSLATARRRVADLPREMRPAFLPLALVEPYLRAMERPRRDRLNEPADISQLARVARIAVAHWLGRI
jgi:phytoene synthase